MNSMSNQIKTNEEKFNELYSQYKISWSAEKYNHITHNFEPINFSEYDIIIKPDGQNYGGYRYQIIKSPKELTNDDLAIICSKGNCSSGFSVFANFITINNMN